MPTTLTSSITADGNAHGAYRCKDVWRGRQKEGVDPVVFERGDQSGDERSDSGSTRFCDDNKSGIVSMSIQFGKGISIVRKQPDFIISHSHPHSLQ